MNEQNTFEDTVKILLLDDIPDHLRPTQRLLERFGYKVEAFGDPNKALNRARSVRFDVFVLDCSMPGMDGPTFIEKAGAAHVSPKRIVFLTGYPKEFNIALRDYPSAPRLIKGKWTRHTLREAIEQVLKNPWEEVENGT